MVAIQQVKPFALFSPRTKKMHELINTHHQFVVADIETTGFSTEKGGRIIEIAGVKVQDGKVVDTFSEFVDPELKISPKITELTGITNEMVKGKRVIGQVLPDFYKFIEGHVFVAHNSTFDWGRFLLPEFKRVGIEATNEVICTATLAKLYLPHLPNHKLDALCEEMGFELAGHHRAIVDTKALVEIFQVFKSTFAPAINEEYDLLYQDVLCMEPVEQKREFKVKRVSYWEKAVTKKKLMQRIYVMLDIGSVYFDIPSKTWYNKDVEGGIDFDEIQNRVFTYTSKHSVEELCTYRKKY